MLVVFVSPLLNSLFCVGFGFLSGLMAAGGLVTGDETTVKGKIVTMMNAVRTLLRMPLIFVNIIVAVYLMLIG